MKAFLIVFLLFPFAVLAQVGIGNTGDPASPYLVQPPPTSPPAETFTNLDDAIKRAQELNGPVVNDYVWSITVDDGVTQTSTNLCSDDNTNEPVGFDSGVAVTNEAIIRPCGAGEITTQ